MEKYTIIRFHSDGRKQLIQSGVSLEDAKNHCNDPKTRKDENGVLIYFDGYVKED